MAKAWQCDICKEYVAEAYIQIGTNVTVCNKTFEVFFTVPYDLCRKCFEEARKDLANAVKYGISFKTKEQVNAELNWRISDGC